ncbi:hypothetical protein B0H10DRAFT_887541 [Mycena sp. CBHHK59/15]|nr:hypothetical protein B0H10DRAFT_887541 [Mycena sp. CBHHK59/15]
MRMPSRPELLLLPLLMTVRINQRLAYSSRPPNAPLNAIHAFVPQAAYDTHGSLLMMARFFVASAGCEIIGLVSFISGCTILGVGRREARI